ncbi:MAG: hypothetical protein R2852_05205 [Bacteroidia bacterium]
MKFKFFKLSAFALLALTVTFTACKTDDPKPEPTLDNSAYTELKGDLETQTLDASKKYLIVGTVFVNDGKVLTIPAGTKLFGQKATKGTLVVNVGGQIIAEGTASNPIIMTSSQAVGEREQGDWGGLILLGKANVNQNNPSIEGVSPSVNFGTFNSSANDNDNSGILKYVRIEYAGIALTPNNETNSLTMGGIGNGTTIDYVQVTYGGDDGYEWFGGTVNCKHLVSYGSWDDDFDCDFGFSGTVQYALSVRDPFNADQSGSNSFEVDNDGSGTNATPKTAAVFSNVTILGPIFDSAKAKFNGNYQHAMHLRRNSELSIFNSVIVGYPIGLNLDGTLANYTGGMGVLDNNILVSTGGNKKAAAPFYAGKSESSAVADYWSTTKSNTVFTDGGSTGSPAYSNAISAAGVNPALIMGYNTVAGVTGDYPKDPSFASFTGATQTGASFSDAKLAGFASTTHKGAFGSTDWTDMWSNFNPQNEAY